MSLTPTSGTATALNILLLQINGTQSAANARFIDYPPQGNHPYLASNPGAWITWPLTPGVAGTASSPARLFFGRFSLFGARPAQGIEHRVITLVARIFEIPVAGFLGQRKSDLEGMDVSFRIVHCHFIPHFVGT